MVVVQGGLVRRLVPRLGERSLIVTGTLLMAAAFFLTSYAGSLASLLVAIGIMAVGNGLNTPSLSSLISRAASGDHQGGVLGVSQSMGALARIVGPLVGTSLLQFGIVTPYLAGGAIMLIACVFAAAAVRQPSTG